MLLALSHFYLKVCGIKKVNLNVNALEVSGRNMMFFLATFQLLLTLYAVAKVFTDACIDYVVATLEIF